MGFIELSRSNTLQLAGRRSTSSWNRGRPRPHLAVNASGNKALKCFFADLSYHQHDAGEGARGPNKRSSLQPIVEGVADHYARSTNSGDFSGILRLMRVGINKSPLLLLAIFLFLAVDAHAQAWTAKLDKPVRFYQTTDLGVLLVGTEKSLYAVDGATGETLWRRKDVSLDETDVAPVPNSDLLLLSFEKGERTRVEAVDLLTGDTIWKSNKIRGAVMQMAVDPSANLLAVVFAKDAQGHADDGFKRHPLLHVLDLATGDEIWKSEISETEMMPARWPSHEGRR